MDEPTAEVLTNCLPPNGWGDLATKSAVEGVRTEVDGLRADVEKMEKGLRADVERNHAAVEKMEKGLRADFEKDLKAMGQGLSDRFTAQLATEIGEVTKEIGKVHEKIGDVRGEQRAQTVTLIVMIFVSMFGQVALARFFPPPSSPPPPPPQIIIQSPGE